MRDKRVEQLYLQISHNLVSYKYINPHAATNLVRYVLTSVRF